MIEIFHVINIEKYIIFYRYKHKMAVKIVGSYITEKRSEPKDKRITEIKQLNQR